MVQGADGRGRISAGKVEGSLANFPFAQEAAYIPPLRLAIGAYGGHHSAMLHRVSTTRSKPQWPMPNSRRITMPHSVIAITPQSGGWHSREKRGVVDNVTDLGRTKGPESRHSEGRRKCL
jgi:hypothetical protein